MAKSKRVKLVRAESPERYQRELTELWRSIHRKVSNKLERNLARIFRSGEAASASCVKR